MFQISSRDGWSKTRKYLTGLSDKTFYSSLDKYGQKGVSALAANTPVDSGITASAWSYRIVKNKNRVSIRWYNSNTNDSVNIAVIVQYGHATGTGGYVQGRDYINPTMRPVFDSILNDVASEIKRL